MSSGGTAQSPGYGGIKIKKPVKTVTKPVTAPAAPTTSPSAPGFSTGAQFGVNAVFKTGTTNTTTTEVQAPIIPVATDTKNGNTFISIPGLGVGGQPYTTNVWIANFQTGTYTQYENNQVHRGMSWFPIRRAEMFIQFTILWPLQSINSNVYNGDSGFIKMQKFQDIIRLHQQQSVLTNPSQPMTLVYFNNTGTGPNNSSSVNNNNLMIYGNNATMMKESDFLSQTISPQFDKNNQIIPVQTDPLDPLSALTYQGWIDTVEKEYVRYKSYFMRSYRMNIINTSTNVVSTINATSASNSLVPNALDPSKYGLDWTSTNVTRGGGININQIVGTIN